MEGVALESCVAFSSYYRKTVFETRLHMESRTKPRTAQASEMDRRECAFFTAHGYTAGDVNLNYTKGAARRSIRILSTREVYRADAPVRTDTCGGECC
jgi:hypothetical protein